MSTTETQQPALSRRPKRADARRNYDLLIAAAREAFTEKSLASLEDIARRAGVGIGTLYRHFPSRGDLIEAVYVKEVEGLCGSADDLARHTAMGRPRRLAGRFVGYMATKQALAEELFAAGHDAESSGCRVVLYSTGEPLLKHAQEAGAVRRDVTIDEVLQDGGRDREDPSPDAAAVDRILSVALDGLRYRPS